MWFGSRWAGGVCEFVDGDDSGKPVTPIEAQTILVQAAQDIVKSRRTAPGSMVAYAGTVLRPSVRPWQRLLSAHIRQAVACAAGHVDQSYQRRARRRDNATLRPVGGDAGRKLVKPGVDRPGAVVDTSGSMSGADVAVCRGEIEATARKVGCRGGAPARDGGRRGGQSSQKSRGPRALGDIHGRGVTDMRVGIRHGLDRRKWPDVIIVLTDGWTLWPSEKTPVPLVVVIISEPRQHVPGTVVGQDGCGPGRADAAPGRVVLVGMDA